MPVLADDQRSLLRRLLSQLRDGPGEVVTIDVSRAGAVLLTGAEFLELVSNRRRSMRDDGAGRSNTIAVVDAANNSDSLVTLLSAMLEYRAAMPIEPSTSDAEALRTSATSSAGLVRYRRDGTFRTVRLPAGDDTAHPPLYLRSGGSSGTPHLVPCALDDSILWGLRSAYERTGWDPSDRNLVVGPISHAASLLSCLVAVAHGQTVVFQGSFTAERTIRTIHNTGISWVSIAPAHMRAMLLHPTAPELVHARGRLHSLHTGAPCDPWTKDNWLRVFGDDAVHEMYSSSERIGMTLASGVEWRARKGTVGRGHLTQISVRDPRGRALGPHEVGTVYMRTGQTQKMLSAPSSAGLVPTLDGFVSVGDYGSLDADGYLYLQPRRHDMFLVGGMNVYPEEIEQVILGLEGVLDVVVVPVAHDTLDYVPKAIVSAADPTLSASHILEYCRRALTSYKQPRSVEFSHSIPRSSSGKPRRAAHMPSMEGQL